MNIRKKPYDIDFIGNNPEFVIKTSPNYNEGRRHYQSWMFTHLNVTNIILTTPFFVLTWQCTRSSSDDPYKLQATSSINSILSQLNAKVVNNTIINQYYNISASIFRIATGNVVKLEMQSKTIGSSSTITWDQNPDPHQMMSAELTMVEGFDVDTKPNYRVLARFVVQHNGVSSETPTLYLYDNNGSVNLPVKMLDPYMNGSDVPMHNETVSAITCAKSMMNVSLKYAESVDGVASAFQQSCQITLVNGTIDQYFRDNNMPDWIAGSNEKLYRKTIADIFGQDNNAVVKTDIFTEQYLYLSNFTASSISSLAVTLTTNHDGVTASSTAATVTIPASSIVRIPVGVSALSISNAASLTSYTVSVSVSQSVTISRTFVIVPRPYDAVTALLVNRVGLYESFVFTNVAEEHVAEGDKTMYNRAERYMLSGHYGKFTARTGLRTEKELSIFRSALHNDGNIIVDGEYAWKISIEPSSVKIADRSEDLLSVEFSFIRTEKFNRNVTDVGAITSDTTISRTDNIIKQS